MVPFDPKMDLRGKPPGAAASASTSVNTSSRKFRPFNHNMRKSPSAPTRNRSHSPVVQAARRARLLPNGKPRYVRCYDGPQTADRYTVVFSGHYANRDGLCRYIGMSARPYHPQGICSREDHTSVIDHPKHSHLGKKIRFDQLPEDCQKLVLEDYLDIWQLH
jgi:hypothetical protein